MESAEATGTLSAGVCPASRYPEPTPVVGSLAATPAAAVVVRRRQEERRAHAGADGGHDHRERHLGGHLRGASSTSHGTGVTGEGGPHALAAGAAAAARASTPAKLPSSLSPMKASTNATPYIRYSKASTAWFTGAEV